MNVERMRLEKRMEKYIMKGKMAKIINVSGTLIVRRMTNAASTLMEVIKTSSGVWWANSVTSNRSVVMRDMIWPILVLS